MNACVCAWTGSYRGRRRQESTADWKMCTPPQTGKPELASPLTVVGDGVKIWLLATTCDTHLGTCGHKDPVFVCVQTGCEWEHGSAPLNELSLYRVFPGPVYPKSEVMKNQVTMGLCIDV